MDWIMGIQNAIDYIEAHMTEELDYEAIATESFSSSFHFQRMFSILCGYTLGEYIRNRRLTLAGAELATTKAKVIDIALKYGYDSPESFTKAFRTFHGIPPSQARRCGAMLKAFSRLSIKVTLEGGSVMHYKIEQKPAMTLTGYKKRLTGSPMSRDLQDHNFICDTRINQAILTYLAHDVDTTTPSSPMLPMTAMISISPPTSVRSSCQRWRMSWGTKCVSVLCKSLSQQVPIWCVKRNGVSTPPMNWTKCTARQ